MCPMGDGPSRDAGDRCRRVILAANVVVSGGWEGSRDMTDYCGPVADPALSRGSVRAQLPNGKQYYSHTAGVDASYSSPPRQIRD